MKKSRALCLCCLLLLPLKVSAYSSYADDNPFVEAMLRMMEIFGLIDRDRLPLGVPYMAGYGAQMPPGFGGMGGVPGMSPLSGFGGVPGMGAYPGMVAMPGAGGWPQGAMPGTGGMPGPWNAPAYLEQGAANRTRGHLDGIWELENGTFVVLQSDAARLYLSRNQYQDFAVRYDRQRLWWKPVEGGAASRYLYQVREGRMMLRDENGNVLLMRRRR